MTLTEKSYKNQKPYLELIKRTCIKLAKEHKEKCNDPYCGVSLYHLVELMRHRGIELNKEELKVFM